ncbi:MAG: hypothetical protein AAF098_05160 [Pseudomonadota bacterium]
MPPDNHKLGKKSRKPLLRPITPPIAVYLKQAFALSPNSRYVFTNDGTDDVMGVRAPLALPYNVMQHLRRYEKYHMKHFSMHDLRRTARSRFSKLTSFHVAEVMLGHAIGSQAARVYDQYSYLEEQAEAYEAWCQLLFSLIDHA